MENYVVDGIQIPCVDDTACPYSSICYFPDKMNPKQGVCGCDAEWGDIGAQCNQPGAGTIYRITSSSIIIFFASLVLLAIIIDAMMIHKTSGLMKLDVRVTTLFACITSLFGLISYQAFNVYMAQHPLDIAPMSKQITVKKRSAAAGRTISLAVFSFFFIVAILNVSILWLEVAITTRKFKYISNPQISKKYRWAIFFFDAVFGIAVIVLNWLNGTASYLGVVGVLLIITMYVVLSLTLSISNSCFFKLTQWQLNRYTYSAYSITKAFRNAPTPSVSSKAKEQQPQQQPEKSKTEKMKDALSQIRRCSIRVVILLILWVICLSVTAVKYPKMRTSVIPKGQVLDFSVFTDLGYLLVIASLASTAMYLHKPSKVDKSTGEGNDATKETTNDSKRGSKNATAAIIPSLNTDDVNEKDVGKILAAESP